MSKISGLSALPILRLTDFGARPDSGEDAQPAMQRAIAELGRINGPAVLECPPGRYDFYPQEATRVPYYISNTASEQENPDVTKTVGLLFKGIHDLLLDGQDSLFVFHGKQTMLVIDNCERLEISSLHMDYHQPTVVEMTVLAVTDRYWDIRVAPGFPYEIEESGQLFWTGEGYRFHEGPMQVYDPLRNTTWRVDNQAVLAERVEELAQRTLRLHFAAAATPAPDIVPGMVLQARDGIRDQVGVFMVHSRDIRFHRVGIHFLHGLGVVGQFSRDLTFSQMDLSPQEGSGRTVAGFADFLHLSGCRGLIRVEDSRFTGAHDDPINVHGTHLRIIGQEGERRIRLRFMHPQTYGFAAFHAGDEIEFVRAASLMAYAGGRVTAVERVSPRELVLELADPLPAAIQEDDVIENITWTPEVEIRHNRFARIPTRGILISTRRRVVIADNHFLRMQMSAIEIGSDADAWYESGRVMDVTVVSNHFIECGGPNHPVIHIAPANRSVQEDAPVHRGIRIEHNRFETADAPVLAAKSTAGLIFAHNTVAVTGEEPFYTKLADAIRLTACSGVELTDNRFVFGQMTEEEENRNGRN